MTRDREMLSGEHGGAGQREDHVDEMSLLELANVLLKRWKLVAGLPLIAAVLTLAISLIVPKKYTATATFVPETESEDLNLPGGLVGLAAQFGVAVPLGAANSPQFYADVLESRTLRDEVLLAQFPDPRTLIPGDSATLLELLRVRGRNETERLEKGRERLEDAISIDVANETNIVSLSAETRYSVLSADIANLFLVLLNRFNQDTRKSNAHARRLFIEGRVLEVEAELHEAEEELQRFLERNRQFQGSPELAVQNERLQRQLTIKQEVFTTLLRQYEEARIQEVDDTPVITVIDRAMAPDRKSSPKIKLNTALAFVFGGILGVLGAFGREFGARARAKDEREYEELASRWATIRAELRSIFSRRGSTGS